MNSKLGKLIAVHSASPAFLQRAAIVAGLSFLFFLVTFIFYFVWQNFLYFVLASGFMIVQIFTMTGWWMQKRNAVSVFANGILYRKQSLSWGEITNVERHEDSSLSLVPTFGEPVRIPNSIQGLDRIESFIRERLG